MFEKTEGAIKDGQSKDTGNVTNDTRNSTKIIKKKHNTGN
jgi:hypothetical protein